MKCWQHLVAAMLLATGTAAAPAQSQLRDTARQLVAEGRFADAAAAFRRCLELEPGDLSVLRELAAALEADGRWREAMPYLERFVAGVPGDARALTQLAQFQAWSGDRESARKTFEHAYALDPRDPELLTAFGELLSWEPDSRARADLLFRRALAVDPGNRRARLGKANLAAWSGHHDRALASFDSLVREAPDDIHAVRGRGVVLSRLGRLAEAAQSLEHARAMDPGDAWSAYELARVELARGRYASARGLLSVAAQVGGGEYRNLRDSVVRASGAFVELTGHVNERQSQLDMRGLAVRTSAAAAYARVAVSAEPMEFEDDAGVFEGNRIGASFSVAAPGALMLEASARRWSLNLSRDDIWEGHAGLTLNGSGSLSLAASVDRAPVVESRRSLLGDGTHGGVRATSGRLGATWRFWRADVQLRLSGTELGGEGLATNHVYGAEGEVGLTLRTYSPWVRAGYEFRGQRFEYFADTLGADPMRRAGYFSPFRGALNLGVLQVAQRVGARLAVELDLRVGSEQIRLTREALWDMRAAGSASAHAAWRVAGSVDLDVRYLYVNALDVFAMHRVNVALRRYF